MISSVQCCIHDTRMLHPIASLVSCTLRLSSFCYNSCMACEQLVNVQCLKLVWLRYIELKWTWCTFSDYGFHQREHRFIEKRDISSIVLLWWSTDFEASFGSSIESNWGRILVEYMLLNVPCYDEKCYFFKVRSYSRKKIVHFSAKSPSYCSASARDKRRP